MASMVALSWGSWQSGSSEHYLVQRGSCSRCSVCSMSCEPQSEGLAFTVCRFSLSAALFRHYLWEMVVHLVLVKGLQHCLPVEGCGFVWVSSVSHRSLELAAHTCDPLYILEIKWNCGLSSSGYSFSLLSCSHKSSEYGTMESLDCLQSFYSVDTAVAWVWSKCVPRDSGATSLGLVGVELRWWSCAAGRLSGRQ